MPVVRATPNQYLLIGRAGRLENHGTAVQKFLWPGSIHVLVPSNKQEAAFEFTQETKDGIPLRFKGIVIYRITDPLAAAELFDFGAGKGVQEITALLTHICLGELRHAVSHMTMTECIEQRKSTLSQVVDSALRQTVQPEADDARDWGITIEVAQLAQVFIVDAQLRQQLEAEVRNEIKLKSDQSEIRTREETRLTEMESEGRVQEQKLAGDRESLRREEELELAAIARERRMQVERVATERQALQLEQDRFHAEMEVEANRLATETPVRLQRIASEQQVLREDHELRGLRNRVKALDVEHDLMQPRAEQELRVQLLPIEQAPGIVESAAKVLSGTNLSIYGDDAQLVGQLAPIFGLLARAVERATPATPVGASPG